MRNKYYNIVIEGIDKTGKDLLKTYIEKLSNYKYIVTVRGIISQLSHTRIFNREYKYDLPKEDNNIYVYLYVDKEDWQIRCNINNEPKIDYDEFNSQFDRTISSMKDMYPNLKILTYDTSKFTPYEIAKDVINKVNNLNKEVEDERIR